MVLKQSMQTKHPIRYAYDNNNVGTNEELNQTLIYNTFNPL